MFEIGEYIVYGVKGVCRIEDITHIDISGADKDRLYYVLAPVGDGSGRIYAPTDNQKITMRKVISREEADQLIEDMMQSGRNQETVCKCIETCAYRTKSHDMLANPYKGVEQHRPYKVQDGGLCNHYEGCNDGHTALS